MFHNPIFQYAPFLAGLLNLVVAVIVYRRNAAFRVNRRFSLFSFAIAVWNLGAFFEENIATTQTMLLFWSKVSHLGGTFAAPLGLHFVLRFTGRKKGWIQKWLLLSYIISTFSALLMFSSGAIIRGAAQYTYGHHAIWGPLYPMHLANLLINVALTFYFLISTLKQTVSNVERNRLRYGLWGFTILMITSLFNFLPAFGYNTFAPGHVGTVIFLILVLFGIYRYRLMNIRLAFAKSGLLILFWLVLGFVYSLILLGMHHLYPPDLFVHGHLLFNFAVAGLFIVAYHLTAKHMLPRMEKIIYPLKSDLRKLMPEMDSRIILAKSSQEVAEALLDIAYAAVKVPAAVFYLRPLQDGVEFRCHGIKGALSGPPPELLSSDFILTRQKIPLIREEIKRDLELESLKEKTPEEAIELIREFDELGMEALIPLSTGSEIFGLLFFSRKRLGGVYDPDDLEAIHLLATRAAAAIANFETSESLKEKEHLARVGEMTAVIAHEIKNPLGVIRSAAEKLSSLSGQVPQLPAMIIEEASRLDGIVRSFLVYARPQSAQLETVEVRKLLGRCAELFLSESRANIFSIKLPDSAMTLQADLDPDLFKQVFYNIIHNSLDARPDGEVKIIVETCDQEVRIAFSDNCGGMKKETLNNIFQPFFTTKTTGTGLGMAIVKKLVLAMKGKIYISSENGTGTTVNISFPLSKKD